MMGIVKGKVDFTSTSTWLPFKTTSLSTDSVTNDSK